MPKELHIYLDKKSHNKEMKHGRPISTLVTSPPMGEGIHHHHHHHYHINGAGFLDDVGNFFTHTVPQAAKQSFTPALGNQIVGGLKQAAHYGIPAITGALGGAAGAELGPVGAIAGSAAGSYAGHKIDSAIGVGLGKRKGRFVKGSPEAIAWGKTMRMKRGQGKGLF